MTQKYCGSTGTNGGSGSLADPYSIIAANAALAAGTLNGGTLYMLDIEGGATELDLTTALDFSTAVGATIRSAERGARWTVRASRKVAPASWTQHATYTNVYYTSAEREVGGVTACTVPAEYPNGLAKPYTRIDGQYSAAVLATLNTTPGSYWTGPVSAGDATIYAYVHPFDNGALAVNGGIQISRLWGTNSGTSAVNLTGGNTLMDMNMVGHIWRSPSLYATAYTGTNGYNIVITSATSTTSAINCKVIGGDKHCVGMLAGVTGGKVWLESVQGDQCNPYATAGGSTVFVAYDGDAAHTGQDVTLFRCKTLKNKGLVGSDAGTNDITNVIFMSHNAGSGMQFRQVTIDSCYFPGGNVNITSPASNAVVCLRTRMGMGTYSGSAYVADCFIDSQGVCGTADSSAGVIERCVFTPDTTIGNTQGACRILGTVTYNHCTFDMRNAAANFLFSRIAAGAVNVTFKNNLVFTKAINTYQGGVINGLRSGTDTYVGQNNLWVNPYTANPAAYLMYNLTGYTGLSEGCLTLATMKSNGIETAASATVTAFATIDADYRPTAPTSVRGLDGLDVGALFLSGRDVPKAGEIASGVVYGLGAAKTGTRVDADSASYDVAGTVYGDPADPISGEQDVAALEAAAAASQLATDTAVVAAAASSLARPQDGGDQPLGVVGTLNIADLEAAAESQGESTGRAAQASEDQAAVNAAVSQIIRPQDGGPTITINGTDIYGTYDLSAFEAASIASGRSSQLNEDQIEIEQAAADIADTRTLLTVQGTLSVSGVQAAAAAAQLATDQAEVESKKAFIVSPDFGGEAVLTIEGTAEVLTAGDGAIVVNHDTGGTDALRVTLAGDVPVEGATIRAYLTSEYDAGLRNVQGAAITGADGRWLQDIRLDAAPPGDSYTLSIDKPGNIEAVARIEVA